MTNERKIRENRELLYVEQCRKSYREWIETTALFEAYHCIRRDHAINFHAIKKSREKAEMDEVDGNSNRFTM